MDVAYRKAEYRIEREEEERRKSCREAASLPRPDSVQNPNQTLDHSQVAPAHSIKMSDHSMYLTEYSNKDREELINVACSLRAELEQEKKKSNSYAESLKIAKEQSMAAVRAGRGGTRGVLGAAAADAACCAAAAARAAAANMGLWP